MRATQRLPMYAGGGTRDCASQKTSVEIILILMRNDDDIGALFETVEAVVSGSAQWHPGRDGDESRPHSRPHTRVVDRSRPGIFALPRLWIRAPGAGQPQER